MQNTCVIINNVCLPDNSKCAIADGAIWLHLCGAGHLAGRVAVGLRHRCSAAGAPSESCGVTRGPRRGGGSGEARCSAEARGGGSAGGVDTEILVAQLGARKQVSANGLPARAVKRHPALTKPQTRSAVRETERERAAPSCCCPATSTAPRSASSARSCVNKQGTRSRICYSADVNKRARCQEEADEEEEKRSRRRKAKLPC